MENNELISKEQASVIKFKFTKTQKKNKEKQHNNNNNNIKRNEGE